MAENSEGRKAYIRRRFLEAETPEDVDRIRHELIADEDIPRSTVDTVKNKFALDFLCSLGSYTGNRHQYRLRNTRR